MECRDAQFYLRLRRHAADELGPDVTAALEGHLAGCRACAADAQAAATFDRLLASAMKAVPVPSGLRERLITQAAKKQGEAFRQKAYRGGALVAAAMVLVALGLSIFSHTRPKVDADVLVQRAEENSEQATQNWLAEQKLPERLPWDFDYDLFVYRGYDKVGGRDVPVVIFRAPTGNGSARVYLFRHSEFDTKDIQDAVASHFQAKPLIGQGPYRGVTYVVVHSGGPIEQLKRFLKGNKGGLPL